ncbi:hypothetical protein [Prosthecobacter vanneervenii]|uniref:Ribosomal protein S1 n=1 Tax=Prosthecobacter vanneervenii TaxID=48466 RepID=A0A7W7YH29_9BACT|nr:hypothetical protein [Prosthecobacter vanneervenii]MBB5035730.1 ribosomal protein S1 [Prosthecobacter vanneervenii]
MHAPGTRLTATVTRLRSNAAELSAEDGSLLLMLGPYASADGTVPVEDVLSVGQCVVVAVMRYAPSQALHTVRLSC